MLKTIIVGSGPAALTAAIYASRAGLEPLLLASSVKAGGELMNTTEVENYPGFPDGIMGPDLMDAFTAQAEKFGTTILYDDVESITPMDGFHRVVYGGGVSVDARTVIYATGSEYKKLGVPLEEELTGFGVSYCATCDGFFFKEKEIIVVGGGDSGTEEALFLTRFSKVKLLVRGDSMRASAINQNRVLEHEKIEVLFNTEIVALNKTELGGLGAVTVKSGESVYDIPADGLFVAIGSDPNVHLLHGVVDITESGVIKVQHPTTATSRAGIFAAGDVTDSIYRQAVVAAGSGAKAALDVQAYLEAEGFGD